MSYIDGPTLASVWPSLNAAAKEKVCRDIWELIVGIRQVGRPPTLQSPAYYTSADGLPLYHPLLGNYQNVCPVLTDDDALRARIYELFVANNGLSYKDGKDLPEMLPRSSSSVFTHGDIHSGNILVSKEDPTKIIGLVDWESAGFLPDYWEYAMIMRPMVECEDWQELMDKLKPQSWDVSGIAKAQRVLF